MKGFTLIETLIGIVLMLVIFLGIFGVYQMGFRIIGQSRARIIATAIANQKMEFVRNLSYVDVGTISGIPPGVIAQTEVITRNDIDYTVDTGISYVDDPFDGVAPDDSLPNDYKKVKVNVSWQAEVGGSVILLADVAPKGLETSVGGGNLSINVFDALGIGIAQADIHIVNDGVDPPIDVYYQTNDNGNYLVAGAPASVDSYEITVSKSGHSTDRTYGTEDVVNPEKPHITVLEGKLTQASFSIDILSDFSIDTASPYGVDSFSDSFVNDTKISEYSDIFVINGNIELATTTEGYSPSGYLISSAVSPLNLMEWEEFSWNDSEPFDTEIKYRILYATSTEWNLIPDFDLPGNSGGFTISPVNLSGLSSAEYMNLKLQGDLATTSTSTTPIINDWQISWKTNDATPIGNIPFRLRGNKLIGTDDGENPVYKYLQDHISDVGGHIDISNLEWDLYDFSLEEQATSLTLTDTNPSPQPISLIPNVSQSVTLFLSAENSLLAKAKDEETSEDIFSAGVRVFNVGFGYDETLYTDEEGEVLFIPLESGVYNFEVQAVGYQDASGTVSVSNDTTKIIYLTPGEL